MLRTFLNNHVFANLTFALILITGFLSYALLPRQQDPDMNFNWINVITTLPGASAEDVEKLVTDPIEDALKKIPDVRFVISHSREGYSNILLRFEELDDALFDKRVNDLRREIRTKERELPAEAEDPLILEITSSNGFPTAMVAVRGLADDDTLRQQAHYVQQDLERLPGVDTVQPIGLRDPEIHVRFYPDRLHGLGITPTALRETIATRFKDVTGGSMPVGGEAWLVRLQGTTADLEEIARWPIIGANAEIPLGRVADITWAREKATALVRHQGRPAVLMPITKQPSANVLEVMAQLNRYIGERNALTGETGVTLALVDDATHMVRHSLGVMESNALLGLILVLGTTWIFLGSRIALLVSLGIPFSLAGVFALLYSVDSTLNVMVLLGVVIALGMLVDDAVVVVEAIFNRIDRGMHAMDAALEALREVFAPVLASVLTTLAAFLPLMLLPGILGKFMRVIPAVVSLALVISLLEAFWMLPAHVAAMNPDYSRPSRVHLWRRRLLSRIQLRYGRMLTRVLRKPKKALALSILPFVLAGGILATGLVRLEFFAFDPFPLFYINVTMPPGSSLEHTMAEGVRVERELMREVRPEELRASLAYAGQMFTETEPLTGDRYSQILVSLIPDQQARRSVPEIIAAMRARIDALDSPADISFLKLAGGPPVMKPINVKVRGNDYAAIRPAVEEVKKILTTIPGVSDITDDHAEGRGEMTLTVKGDAVHRAGLHPREVTALTRLLSDGETVASFQHQGEKVEVRLQAAARDLADISEILRAPVPLSDGASIPLNQLVTWHTGFGVEGIHHYNFRRAVTVQADLDQTQLDTVSANDRLKEAWSAVSAQYPTISLDFTGMLDDIQESMDAIAVLFIFGVGLMYMILGTQFRSYLQPLLILTTVPMAFTGVVFGLLVAGQPLSLYTLYGVVALSGIAVNAAIVMISAANERLRRGMTPLHAIFHAARRRVIPILITALTTIAGLFSLAAGLGGSSLMWGPVATSIVWGITFSTLLTLFLIPLLFALFMRKSPSSPTDHPTQKPIHSLIRALPWKNWLYRRG